MGITFDLTFVVGCTMVRKLHGWLLARGGRVHGVNYRDSFEIALLLLRRPKGHLMLNNGTPTCVRCHKTPEEIAEYISGALLESEFETIITPTVWMQQNEATYNPRVNKFACTECYIAMGQPVAPGGWKAE